ncbi:DNA mismatch repair protein [Entophlyctis luteolus]|nr:DNA mismatch repair protein [Entophlyctis luteolus]
MPIIKLQEAVVNKIAAGEARAHVSNAIKELIENSLDAGAKMVSITAKDGGLKLLQIQDNGHGISKEDLPLVCERFATSKIKQFEDLETITTFGFRGEALASISHVSHVTITTKTADSPCAWKAVYSDGTMVPPRDGSSCEPLATAGNIGTSIMIEDLFYNIPIRRKALRSINDEYSKILDIVSKYSIHYNQVSFACKKAGANTPDFRSTAGTTRDAIRQAYGSAVAKELVEISEKDNELEFELSAFVSNANFNMKKIAFLLFINNRAVDSANIKRAIESLYSSYLPKNAHPFCYMSLKMKPQNVDVNVHPTKKEVIFLNEEKVIESICRLVQANLVNVNDSRMFLPATINSTPTILPQEPDVAEVGNSGHLLGLPISAQKSTSAKLPAKRYEHSLVRTDSRLRTLDSFIRVNPFQNQPAVASSNSTLDSHSRLPSALKTNNHQIQLDTVDEMSHSAEIEPEPTNTVGAVVATNSNGSAEEQMQLCITPGMPGLATEIAEKAIVDVQLTSILNIRQAIKSNAHHGLTGLIRDHVFVGAVQDRWILLQYEQKLFIVEIEELSCEFFYQLAALGFANFGTLQLESPTPIRPLITLALMEENAASKRSNELQPGEKITENIARMLVDRREMLSEYFGLVIDDQERLCSLPLVLDGYEPNFAKLPTFLLRLGTEVNWGEEQPCFESVCKELGIFYACEPPMPPAEEIPESNENISGDRNHYEWVVEHIVLAAMRQWYLPSKKIRNGQSVVPVVDLHDLYKVFERC